MTADGDAQAGDFEHLLRRFLDERDRPPPAAGPAGATIDRYRIVRLLGRGGQGAVHLAEDELLHRRVAIKVLSGLAASAPDQLARFHREAELASRLDHPALCTVYDRGVHEGAPFLVMRHVEGKTLATWLAEARSSGTLPLAAGDPRDTATKRVGVTRILQLFERVARALHVAHEAGIVHRDLKPGNIMVTPGGEPVVLDFGVAADLDDAAATLTRTGDLCGTPAYMSPEQLELRPSLLDRRSDVFSLGVCLYECLTLRRPFDAPTREGIFQAIASLEPTDPRRLQPSVSRDLGVVIATALQKDRHRRYATALALADDLRRVRELEPIRARPAGWWVRTRRWAQRHPGVAASLTLLFLVLAGGLLWSNALLAENLRSLNQLAQMADLKRCRSLDAWAEQLYPPWPELVTGERGMDAWLAAADRLASGTPALSAALTELAGRAAPPPRAGEPPVFANDLDAVRYDALTELVDGLTRLGTRRAEMLTRREFALHVDERCLQEAAAAWAVAAAEVRADPRFFGLELRPQRGLVPLGRDPRSGLQEFALPQTGRVPARDAATGDLRIGDDTAMVFVLLPGGEFWMGATPDPQAAHNRSKWADADEQPVHRVALAPFLLSKYEMTQAQWIAVMPTNPSAMHAGSEFDSCIFTARHPVERISWEEATDMARRTMLCLPTEAQWEYGCRAGTETVSYTGDDPATLRGHANILDDSVKKTPMGRPPQPGFHDGYPFHAPVGSFLPNPWGLHDMHGNVWELCQDWYGSYRDDPVRDRDGLRLVPPERRKEIVNRSDCFQYDAKWARSSIRNRSEKGHRYNNLGVRPARALQ